jgi:hypothetical protein
LREYFFLISSEGKVLYSDAGLSAAAIPDSRSRWEAIWAHRERIGEIAHSHPIGPLAFSREDETTMSALDTALGKSLLFSVVAPNGMIRRQGIIDTLVTSEPEWARELRRVSGMKLFGEPDRTSSENIPESIVPDDEPGSGPPGH